MKNALISLLNGSPTKFFNEVREHLDNKAVQSVETIMEAVAPAVFEEVEQLDELSKETLNSYKDKFRGSYDGLMADRSKITRKAIRNKTMEEPNAKLSAINKKLSNRANGVELAKKKIIYGPNEEVEHVDEDMGVHTIATKHGGKNGKQFATLVVNKKRRSKADAQKKWTDLIKKNQPKETVWDKHTKLDS